MNNIFSNCKCTNSSEQYRELVCENHINDFECKLNHRHSFDKVMVHFKNSDQVMEEKELIGMNDDDKEGLIVAGKFIACSICGERLNNSVNIYLN